MDGKVRLTATAIVATKIGTAEITPDAMEFDSVPQAIEALEEWASGSFSPVIGAFQSLTIKIEATGGNG